MKIKFGSLLDKLAAISKIAIFILGTKKKSVLNHISRGLDKAQQVKDSMK
jgi:hypothetical protein